MASPKKQKSKRNESLKITPAITSVTVIQEHPLVYNPKTPVITNPVLTTPVITTPVINNHHINPFYFNNPNNPNLSAYSPSTITTTKSHKKSKSLKIYLKRIFNFSQMDFELALWVLMFYQSKLQLY